MAEAAKTKQRKSRKSNWKFLEAIGLETPISGNKVAWVDYAHAGHLKKGESINSTQDAVKLLSRFPKGQYRIIDLRDEKTVKEVTNTIVE